MVLMGTGISDETVKLTVKKLLDDGRHSDLPVTGIVALEKGVISNAAFDSALQYWKSERTAGNELTFEDALVEKGGIPADTAVRLIAKTIRRMSRMFCELAVGKDYLSREHAEKALDLQASKYKSGELILISDFFIQAGLLDETQRDSVYHDQSRQLKKLLYKYEGKSGGIETAEAEKEKQLPATAYTALNKKIISKDQLNEILDYCEREKQAGRDKQFEDVLLEKKYVTVDVLMKLIAVTIRDMNIRLGEMAVEAGLVSQKHIDKALQIQAEKFKGGELILIGDLLINAGLLSKKQRDDLLAAMKPGDFHTRKTGPFKTSDVYQMGITVGELAVAWSFITGEELKTGLKYLKKAYKQGLNISLERILLEKGMVDEAKASLLTETKKFLRVRDLDIKFADAAVEKEWLTRSIAKAMLARQLEEFDKTSQCVSLSAILIEEKLMTAEQCNTLLTEQKREPVKAGGLPADPVKKPERDTASSHEPAPFDAKQPLSEAGSESDVGLYVSEDRLEAVVIIPACYPEELTLETIKEMLAGKNVVYGIIDDSAIEEKLSLATTEEKRFTAARGQPEIPGKDAELIVHFQREYLNPGKVTSDGMIDFRDRGAVPFVAKGDTLVEIIPGEEGQNGTDIFGKIIPVPPVGEVSVTAGKETELSADGLTIVASEDGQPSITVAGEVSVFQEFTVAGDVDFHTGNIVFDGHITVKGTVKEGFSVSGGSLTVKEIDGGQIDLKGNLEVSGGILGSTIRLGGNLQAMYMSDSHVYSYGDVIVKKEIIGSTILTSGACKSEGTTIITSAISALNGIQAGEIGTDVSEKCVLKVGMNAHIEHEIERVREGLDQKIELLAQTQAALSQLEKEQAEYQDLISETAQVQDQGEVRLKKLKEQLEHAQDDDEKVKLKSEMDELGAVVWDAERLLAGYFDSHDDLMNKASQTHEECEAFILEIEKRNSAIREIQEWVKQQERAPVVKAVKNIFQGTLIVGPNTSLSLKETYRNSSVKEVAGDPSKGEPGWVMKILPN